MLKDFALILQQAMAVSVPMPITAVAAQVCAAEHARQGAAHSDEDFSAVIRTMHQLAGASSLPVLGE
jgi:3-hydroxyisobutyrate dehydrogenase-like beta-hydroxyacid dehydrogenase